jgi:hypothetical protein
MRIAEQVSGSVEPDKQAILIACGLYLEGLLPRQDFAGEPAVVSGVAAVTSDEKAAEDIDD